ncbi:RNA methyltransferase [Reinekea marina]|nr:RNA methyltransferase [Reinekea marina]MDN3649876.1 RNA methyltransferase [Reinekea marina]
MQPILIIGFFMSLNIKIVLIKTWHPGNIGAVARAMKNMGLHNLTLVDPVDFPSEEATSRAGQATDILEQATVVSTLKEAIDDCTMVIGTSARDRTIKLPSLSAESCGQQVVAEQVKGNVAIVFGRERMGLHNDEIQQCHFQLNIDANPDYPVLNLSQAVQLVCYEVFKAANTAQNEAPQESEYPLHKELALFHEHLEQTMHDIGFTNEKHPGLAFDHLKALYRRARPTRKELSILRGFLNAAQNSKPKN